MLLSKERRTSMASPEGGAPLTISLVYSPAPRQVREWFLELPAGATVARALAASGVLDEFAELRTGRLVLGIWGRKTTPGHALRDQDRIEIYRGLRVDPRWRAASAQPAGRQECRAVRQDPGRRQGRLLTAAAPMARPAGLFAVATHNAPWVRLISAAHGVVIHVVALALGIGDGDTLA